MDYVIIGTFMKRHGGEAPLGSRPGHPETINVPEEAPGVKWDPKGGETFVYSFYNDIGDPPGAIEASPEEKALGFAIFAYIEEIEEKAQRQGRRLSDEEVVASLRADPDLGPLLGSASTADHKIEG
jgi:hypothetical protein